MTVRPIHHIQHRGARRRTATRLGGDAIDSSVPQGCPGQPSYTTTQLADSVMHRLHTLDDQAQQQGLVHLHAHLIDHPRLHCARPFAFGDVPLFTLDKPDPFLSHLVEVVEPMVQRVVETPHIAGGVQGLPGMDAGLCFTRLQDHEQAVEARDEVRECGAGARGRDVGEVLRCRVAGSGQRRGVLCYRSSDGDGRV